eukprot:TRINITY_DN11403_c0_g1_i1.p2 TRINITY_DN11403_c0_g1~~TRINITY_DN11403_c0_g1_i1.p2  ORF type:complete len:110 (-),score=22.87 TRINITY_DN11403_c0_g1_i1:254-583(-)
MVNTQHTTTHTLAHVHTAQHNTISPHNTHFWKNRASRDATRRPITKEPQTLANQSGNVWSSLAVVSSTWSPNSTPSHARVNSPIMLHIATQPHTFSSLDTTRYHHWQCL